MPSRDDSRPVERTKADFTKETKETGKFKYFVKVRLVPRTQERRYTVKRERWETGYHVAARNSKGQFVATKKWKNTKDLEAYRDKYESPFRTLATTHGKLLDMRKKKNREFIFDKILSEQKKAPKNKRTTNSDKNNHYTIDEDSAKEFKTYARLDSEWLTKSGKGKKDGKQFEFDEI